MPRSDYVQALRERVGHDLLLLPGVTAVIRDGLGRYLLARHTDTGVWSLVGGAVEPGEEPVDALRREVLEELGVRPHVTGIVGAYGGPDLTTTYPNGDRVAYVSVAYACTLPGPRLELDPSELLATGWFTPEEVEKLERQPWVDRVLRDAASPGRAGN